MSSQRPQGEPVLPARLPEQTRPTFEEPSATPPRVEHQGASLIVVTLIQAVLVFALMHLLSRVLHGRPGFAVVFDMLGTGGFIPFATSVTAAMQRQRGLVLVILLVTLLAAWPWTLVELEHLVVPIGVGILVGTGLRRILREGGMTA